LAQQRLQAVSKISRLPTISQTLQGSLSYAQKRRSVEELVRQQAAVYGIGPNQAEEFAVVVADDIVGLGGLETLIRDETIFNVTIKWMDGENAQVGLHRIGSNVKEQFAYPLADNLNTFRESIIGGKAVRFSGQPVNWTYASPHVTLYLPSHRIRIAANMLHDTRSMLASVRMNRTGQPDLDEIYRMGMIPNMGIYRFLKAMLASRATFLVVGSTGSGKTTLLRGLLHSVDPSDYLYVVEDSPELDLDSRSDRHDMILALVPTKERTMANLIRDSQRFMADRIVIGEALDDSIIDWFTVANVTGGSGLTMHAEEPASIWRRIKNMVGSKLSEREVFERMAESVDVILFVRQRHERDPERQIENIWVLTHQLGADGKPVYGELWGYDTETRKTLWRGVIPESIQDKFNRIGVRLVDDTTDAKFVQVPNRVLHPMLGDIVDSPEQLSTGIDVVDSDQVLAHHTQARSIGDTSSKVSEAEAFAAVFGMEARGTGHSRKDNS
jgi:Flp pilus assembly CpaF family ATPase